jgi:hypothetical protein
MTTSKELTQNVGRHFHALSALEHQCSQRVIRSSLLKERGKIRQCARRPPIWSVSPAGAAAWQNALQIRPRLPQGARYRYGLHRSWANLAKAYLPPVGTEDGRTGPRRGRDVLPIVHVPGWALAIEAVACSACTCQRQTPSRGPNTRTHPILRVRLFHELLQRLDRSLDW